MYRSRAAFSVDDRIRGEPPSKHQRNKTLRQIDSITMAPTRSDATLFLTDEPDSISTAARKRDVCS